MGFIFWKKKFLLYFLKQKENNSRQKISFCSKIQILFFPSLFFVLYICITKELIILREKQIALKISSWLVSKFWISVPGISEEDKFFKHSWKNSKRKLLFRRLIFSTNLLICVLYSIINLVFINNANIKLSRVNLDFVPWIIKNYQL